METVNDTLPPTEPPPYQQPGRRLTRATDDKVVGGLAGGLGRYFGVDPVVFRIAFVVLTLAGGSGILLYLVGWLMIPDDAGGAAIPRLGTTRNSKLVAAVLVGAVMVHLVEGDHDISLGLVLVGLGALFLWSKRERDGVDSPAPPVEADPEGELPPVAATAGPAATFAPPSASSPPARPRSAVVPVTLSLLAVLAGGLTLFGVPLTTGLALALLLTGGGLVLGAWRGRARWLIPVGLVLSVALATASVIDVPFRGGTGEVAFRPATLEEIRTPYRLAAGELVVDLGGVDLRGETLTVVASVAAGRLDITVPAGVAVEIDAHVGAGELHLLGQLSEGIDIRREVATRGPEGAGRLILRARAGVGEVEVRRAIR